MKQISPKAPNAPAGPQITADACRPVGGEARWLGTVITGSFFLVMVVNRVVARKKVEA